MAINNSPIFTGLPDVQATTITAANTKSDGSGTIGADIFKAFTADATNGGYVSDIRFSPFASVAATATTATVLRIYLSSVTSGVTTSSNTWLIQEIAAPSQTADQTTVSTNALSFAINRAIPPGYTILVSAHHAPAANTGWQCVVFGGKYTAQS